MWETWHSKPDLSPLKVIAKNLYCSVPSRILCFSLCDSACISNTRKAPCIYLIPLFECWEYWECLCRFVKVILQVPVSLNPKCLLCFGWYWRKKQTEQAPSLKQSSILGQTVNSELYVQYLWKRHSNWKTRPPGLKSPRALPRLSVA